MPSPPVDLLLATAALVAVRSESFAERALADRMEQQLSGSPHLTVERVGDNVVARTTQERPTRVLLAGHLDTVPANGNAEPRIDGDVLWGLGSADMKGGLAVMAELARCHAEPPVDVTYVFYAREEVAAEHSGLLELAAERPDLLRGDLAILGEPTGASVEAGCQGVVRFRVTLAGIRAHTARAWMGRNAIHRLGRLLAVLEAYEPRQPEVEGCRFHESLVAVGVEGGVAGNVVPDRAAVTISHRFAPDRTIEEAEAHVRGLLEPLLDDDDVVEVIDRSPAAWPATGHPVVQALVARHGLEVHAKLGWTDVARFASWGVPAINLGPGDATLAHTHGERVDRASLQRTWAVLDDLLTNPIPPGPGAAASLGHDT